MKNSTAFPQPSKRNISSFIVMDILEKAQTLQLKGMDIIHLEIGEPDFDTPEPVINAGIKALRAGHTHYTHSLGILELRESLCDHYMKTYNVSIDPDQVIITNGTSPAIMVAFGALMDTKDELIIQNPHYPCYPNIARLVNAEPVKINVFEEDSFNYRVEDIKKKISKRTKGIVINSPNNPTGAIMDSKHMEELAELGITIVSDEIYHGLVYGEKAHSILEYTRNAIVLSGFSKLYAMTGWRLGYIISPPSLKPLMHRIQQNVSISAAAFTQYAAISALTECQEHAKNMRNIYDERRKFILHHLKKLGFHISHDPTGAFYVFANCKRFKENSYEFAFQILEQAGIAVTPGIDFGENGEGYIRFSYANSIENIDKAMKRLEKFLQKLQ